VSFRNRLGLFFVLIVIVPMIAVAAMLFSLLGDSESSIRSANIGARQDVARKLLAEERRAALGPLKAVAHDDAFSQAVFASDVPGAQTRAKELLAAGGLQRIVLVQHGSVAFAVGDKTALAPARLTLKSDQGEELGGLYVSVVDARSYSDTVRRLTGMQVVARNGGRLLETSLAGRAAPKPPTGDDPTVQVGGQRYTADVFDMIGFPGQRILVMTLGVPRAHSSTDVRNGRLKIVGILVGFLLLALACAWLVLRELQEQLAGFLDVARRLADGDFSAKVTTVGKDEFAGLGEEFNKMSRELERRLVELEQERARVQDSMRRLGDAVASKLDRDALLKIVVRTAVDGRAYVRGPDRVTLQERASMGNMNGLEHAVQAVEAEALRSGSPQETSGAHANAMAHPLRGTNPNRDAVVGVVSVGRSHRSFTQSERELFNYLAGQAARSMEDVDRHETVTRESITDDLTGLANRRAFDEALTHEIERAKRFGGTLGLVLIDLDHFKNVNDTYGHQQGDFVLREVARVLRESSRDIDHPVRYGGEELGLVLPGTDIEGAFHVADRVRRSIESLSIRRIDGGGTLRVTASCGVAALPLSAADERGLVKAADDALYQAKAHGRNNTRRAR
jgi:diguanylate cyclase (GGDEF)-like protein